MISLHVSLVISAEFVLNQNKTPLLYIPSIRNIPVYHQLNLIWSKKVNHYLLWILLILFKAATLKSTFLDRNVSQITVDFYISIY